MGSASTVAPGIYTGDRDERIVPDSAQAAVDAVMDNDTLTTVETSGSLMDGQSGFQITIENPANASGDIRVMHVPPGPLGISPGRRLWIAFFDRPEGLLAIMVGGSVGQWDEALLTAEPVLESVTIGR